MEVYSRYNTMCIIMLSARVSQFCVHIHTSLSSFTAQCPELPPILNGAIRYGPDFTPDFDFGTLATHSCDLGFRRVGVEIRVCLISMTWFDEPPVCECKIHLIYRLWESKYHYYMVQDEVKCMYLAVPRERIMFSACAFLFVVSVNMHTRVLCSQTNCL